MIQTFLFLFLFQIAVLPGRAASKEYVISRIVGGVNAIIEEAPWQVTIHYYPINHCGGSIIDEDTILTSGHCFAKHSDPKAFQVRVGTEKRSVGGEMHKVKKIIVHPKFVAKTYFYDIAIVKLSTKLHFSKRVKPIELPSQNETLPVGEYGMVTGWGRLKKNGSFPKVLQKVYLPILPQKICKKSYEGVAEIIDEMFCAGTLDGLKDSCNGDSGGPFVVNNKLFGISSFGITCASDTYPGVFVAVNKLRDWIDETMNENKVNTTKKL